jgi:DNA-binding LytR/AlgR family response regulator
MGFNECKDCKKKICHQATRCHKCAMINIYKIKRLKNASKYTKQKK